MIARDARQATGKRNLRSQESGFAYLMALFMVLLVLVASTGAILSLRTDRRRQREDDMIWRGNQYVRAIRLYYRKAGHYPQNLDELQKGLPEIHFLRLAAYKDPVNQSGGDWRFIYVNAAGQIIGSVKFASLQQMALMDMNGGKMPTASTGLPDMSSALSGGATSAPALGAGSATGAQAGQNGAPSAPGGTTSPDQSSTQNSTSGQNSTPTQSGQTPPTSPSTSAQTPQSGAGTFGNPIVQQPTGPVDGPVIGGFLTGVGSTVDQDSVKVYNGGTNYNQWEFIWNPIEDQARAVQQGVGQSQGILPGLLGPGSSGGTLGQPGGTGMGTGTSPATGTNPAGGIGTPTSP